MVVINKKIRNYRFESKILHGIEKQKTDSLSISACRLDRAELICVECIFKLYFNAL